MKFRIGYPVDGGKAKDSFVVVVRACLAEHHSCKGGGMSALNNNMGAAFVFVRMSEFIKSRYRYEFEPCKKNIENCCPNNLFDEGYSDSAACALAMVQYTQSGLEEPPKAPLVVISCAFKAQESKHGLRKLFIEQVTKKGAKKAKKSLQNKWEAANREKVLALVLHEKDGKILCEETQIEKRELSKEVFSQIKSSKSYLKQTPIVTCKPNQLLLLAQALEINISPFVYKETRPQKFVLLFEKLKQYQLIIAMVLALMIVFFGYKTIKQINFWYLYLIYSIIASLVFIIFIKSKQKIEKKISSPKELSSQDEYDNKTQGVEKILQKKEKAFPYLHCHRDITPKGAGKCSFCHQEISSRDWEENKSFKIRAKEGWKWICCICLKQQKPIDKIADYNLLARLNKKNLYGKFFLAKSKDKNNFLVVHSLQANQKKNYDPEQWKQMLQRINRGHRVISTLPKNLVVHPSKILETYEPEYYLYYTMAYKPGINLKNLLKIHKKFSYSQALPFLYQIAFILNKLNQNNIVHRDLKPTNIFCTIDRKILVTNFSLAKYEHSQEENQTQTDFETLTFDPQTEEGKGVGTPRYISPEQIRDALNVTNKCDIWGWGVIAHEVLTGNKLFSANRSIEVIREIRKFENYSVEKLPKEIPTAFADLIRAALKKVPEERPSSNDLVRGLLGVIKQNLPGKVTEKYL